MQCSRQPLSRAFAVCRWLAAAVCLGSAYQCAVTSYALPWVEALLVSTLVIATGRVHWAPNDTTPPQDLPWPGLAVIWALVPGWLLTTTASFLKLRSAPPIFVLVLWVIGAAWLLAGAWVLSRRSRGSVTVSRATIGVWACGLAVVAAAVVLRAWGIDTVPRYVHCDEGSITITAQLFFKNPNRDWFAPPPNAGGYMQHMILFYYLGNIFTLLFGVSLTAARVSDVILGVLSVALLFDGVRRASNLPTATAAAFLFAANHCAIAYSRIATPYIQTAFVVVCAFGVLVRLWTSPSYFNAVLLGLVVAFGVQTYQASVLVVPLICIIIAILWILHPAQRRALRVPAVLFAITALTASSFYAVALYQQPAEMLYRGREINIFAPDRMAHLKRDVHHTDSVAMVIAYQAWNSLLGFEFGHDTQPQYNIDKPMADAYTGALIIPGMILALFALRRFLATNALVFTVGYLLAGLGLQHAPGHNRATGALPLGMVLAAIALVQCCTTLWGAGGKWRSWGRNITVAAVVVLCIVANLQIYFVHYRWSRTVGDAESEAAWIARKYADRYRVHLVDWPGNTGYEGQHLILADTPVERPINQPAIDYVKWVPLSGADLFVFRYEDTEARDALLARAPGAREEFAQRDPTVLPAFHLVFVGVARSSGPQPPASANATLSSRR
jgi:4-amino-4-deoxy-L-arabinose transferase-like glycosyltransferase